MKQLRGTVFPFLFQTVDKTNVFRHFAKSFGRAFSKAREVEGAKPSSTPAGIEKVLGVFFLCIACNAAKRSVALASFLLRLSCQKKKRLNLLCNLITYTPFVYTLGNGFSVPLFFGFFESRNIKFLFTFHYICDIMNPTRNI